MNDVSSRADVMWVSQDQPWDRPECQGSWGFVGGTLMGLACSGWKLDLKPLCGAGTLKPAHVGYRSTRTPSTHLQVKILKCAPEG